MEKFEKFLNVLTCIVLVMVAIWLIFMSVAAYNMIQDHKCWVDGYTSQRCQKYIQSR